MRAPAEETVTLAHPADTVFQAALGVQQNTKNVVLLAVQNEGRKLVVREKSMMSNRKFHQVWVEEDGSGSRLHVVVGTDPRTPKAMMDGKANAKSLTKYLENVQAALSGGAPAPSTPVSSFYLQKKTEVPWTDPEADPEIELDGNLVAMYGL